MPNNPVRLECYDRIRQAMKAGVTEYYREYPDLMGDDRSLRAIEKSVHGLRMILEILDEYVISRKEKG